MPPRRRPPLPPEPEPPKVTATFELIDGTKITLAGNPEPIADAAWDIIQDDRKRHQEKGMTDRDPPRGAEGEPAPDEYDEPVEIVQWGAMLPDGTTCALPSEEIARLSTKDREGFALISRKVVYDPWRVRR